MIVCLGFEGCTTLDKEDEQFVHCGVSDPLSGLSWLSEQYETIKNTSESGIILFQYNSKEVIEVQSSLMSSTNNSQYFCDGTKINFEDPEGYQDYITNRVEIKILYGVDLWNL